MVPNFVMNLLNDRKVSHKEEDEIKWATSSQYSSSANNVRESQLKLSG